MDADELKDVSELEAGIKNNDLEQVQKLLDDGVHPNFLPYFWWLDNEISMDDTRSKIIKLLVDHGFFLGDDFLMWIFDSDRHNTELLKCIIDMNAADDQLLQKIFVRLVFSEYKRKSALDVLRCLLDQGMPLDEYIEDNALWSYSVTPLHISVMVENIDFVTLLLERGADVSVRSHGEDESTSLITMAARKRNETIVRLLMKYGANINEEQSETCGFSAFHEICTFSPNCQAQFRIFYMMVDHGADLNSQYMVGKTGMALIEDYYMMMIYIKEIARMKFENLYVCPENLDEIEKWYVFSETGIFKQCLAELRRMKQRRIYNNVTLFDVLKMRRERKKLTLLTRNDEFVSAFRCRWSRESFKYYCNDLDDIFEDAVKRRDVLMSEARNLRLMFEDFNLPELVVQKLAYFVHQDLFF